MDEIFAAIVPQIAMSAGTMIACSCKSILMGKESNLGPVDPQIAGIPAYGVIEEFKRAAAEIKKDPAMLHLWLPIIQQYRPTYLSRCENAIKWSKQFVKEQLEDVMFHGSRGKRAKVDKILRELSDYTRGHGRHIHIDECETMGLKIERLEDDNGLQDLVLTVHHCFMHTIMNTASAKLIENHNGAALIKQAPAQKP